MRILVTGGAGFIGSHVADACLKAGHDVVVIDDLCGGHRDNVPQGARLEEIDIRSPAAAALVASEQPEVLIHHAAQMSVTRSVEEPAYDADVNVLGMINLLEAGRSAGLKRVVFASSGGTVYGESDKLPFDESLPTHPVCPYGVSKLSGEHYLFYYHRVYGIHYVTLRYANVYGPRQDPHGEAGVVAIFSKRLLAGQNVKIFGDGSQTRDYTYVGDVVRANMAALESDFVGPVNIGTGIETNVNDLYSIIKDAVGGPGEARHAEPREGELKRSVLDASFARQALGWQPQADLREGLTATVDFFRSRS